MSAVRGTAVLVFLTQNIIPATANTVPKMTAMLIPAFAPDERPEEDDDEAEDALDDEALLLSFLSVWTSWLMLPPL